MELLQILTYLNGQTSYLIGSTEQMLLQQVSSLCKNMTHKKTKSPQNSQIMWYLVRTKCSAKWELRMWGVPPPFFTVQTHKVLFPPSPFYALSSLQLNSPTGQLYRASLIFGPRRIKY